MRIILFISLIFVTNFGFSQTEKDTYEIYSLTINNILEGWYEIPLKSILVVERFKNKYEEDFSLLEELAKDTIPINSLQWLVKDPVLQKRFSSDTILKKSIIDLISDFENHPKINPHLLQTKGVEVKLIKSWKFYNFHRKYQDTKKTWAKIKEKYDSNLVFQLSKVNYTGKYATFYYSYHCGGLCASANIVIMEKIDGNWKLLKTFNLWVS